MNFNQNFESAQKSLQSSVEQFTPQAMQQAFQPMMDNMKAWGELVQQQTQESQNVATETFEAFKNAKEPQAVVDVMSQFGKNLLALTSKNFKDTVALSVAQFKGNVDAMQKILPASDAVTNIANSMKDSASKMGSSIESSANEGYTAVKKARIS